MEPVTQSEHAGPWTLAIAALLFIGPIGAWSTEIVLAQRELRAQIAALPPDALTAERYVVERGPGADEADRLVEMLSNFPSNDHVWHFPDAGPDVTDAEWKSVSDYFTTHRKTFESANAMLGRAGVLSGDYCVRSKPYKWQLGLRMFAALRAIEQEALLRQGQRDAAWRSWFEARPLVHILERMACASRATPHISWKSLVALERLLNGQPPDAELIARVRETLEDESWLHEANFGNRILHNAFVTDRAVSRLQRVPWLREIMRADAARRHREALNIIALPLAKRLPAFIDWERSAGTWASFKAYSTSACPLGYTYEGEVMARARHRFALCALDLLTQYEREGTFPGVAPGPCRLDELGKPVEFKTSGREFNLTLAGGYAWPNHVSWTYQAPNAPEISVPSKQHAPAP